MSGKANEYRWRPRRNQEDPWSRGRELVGGVLRYPPKPEKKKLFCHSRRMENILSSVLCTPAVICFFFIIHQLPPHDTGHRVKTVTLLRWVGDPSNERTPYRITQFMTHSLVLCRSMSVQDSVDLGPTSAPDLLTSFFGFFQNFGTFRFKKRAHRKLYLKFSDGYLWNSFFNGNFAFLLA